MQNFQDSYFSEEEAEAVVSKLKKTWTFCTDN